ncbi:MAG: HYR domain-containing protein [Bacteroidota bacterium]
MRTTIIPRLKHLELSNSMATFFMLILLAVPNFLFGQCPPEVMNLPSDITINDNDECTSIVTWVEPTYSLNCFGFTDSFDAEDPTIWTIETNGQNGSVVTGGAPEMINITGSGNGTNNVNTNTDFCITIPFDGRINFDWDAEMIGGGSGAQMLNDEPAYTIDGVETRLNVLGTPVGNNIMAESGSVTDLEVTAGQVFCFRVRSNNRGAELELTAENFTFEITQIEQTDGPALDSEQGIGDYTIEYTVPTCDGSTLSCDFNVTVIESIEPVTTCPADITMSADTDRCTAVVCFDVEVTDNCDAILPEAIDGFEFLGTFQEHNYFVSDPGNVLGWEEANAAAAAVGGHLVVITSEEEQQFLIDNIDLGAYRIGLRYSPSLDEFKWVNGEPFTFEAWGPGQPGGLLDGDYVFNLDFFGSFLDGWYDTPSILPLRYIVELDSYQTELIAGFPAGSNFPVGVTEVSYVGIDASGNRDTCSFNVIVEDNQAPVIDCPVDSIIQLGPEQCDTLVTFDDPDFTDNCPDAVITQIAGLPSGSVFPIGENVVSFEAVDTSGNADTCSWSIIVNDYIPQGLACRGEINFSVDEMTCSGSLLPSMVVDVSFVGCADSCTISIIEPDGSRRPADFTSDDIGNTYDYEICCGGICCWGIVNVEYKFKPIILCTESDTLSCTQSFDESLITPDVSMSCAQVDLIKVDEFVEQLSCDTLFTAKMTTLYTAIDEFGNTSDTCSQTIFLRRTNLDSITPVTPFALFNNNALNCGSGFATTDQGYPFPALSVTGAPRLRLENDGFVDLFPFQSNIICNGYAEFRDEILPGSSSCVTKILRTFTIGEWWCSETNEREFVQLIEVVDFDGPNVTCPADMTISTSSFSCEGFTALDLPVVSDACNGTDIKIDLSAPTSSEGFIANYDGHVIDLPVGVNELTYRVYDDCGNRTDCSFNVTVRDDADPIAICDQFTVVGFGLEDLTKVSAEDIDDGSFDECGPVSLSVARMDAPGFDDLIGFGPDVDITCDDVGNVVMVGLLVTDAGGNTNMCMVSIEVQDKIDAQMLCPGDMTVECNLPFDPDNLGAFFGEVEVFDNCPASNTIDDQIFGELNTCGSGVLTRQIRLINAQGDQVDFCQQLITFESGDPLTFSDITPPPAEQTVTGCGIDSIDPSILGMPIVPDRECQQASIGIENDTFPFTQNGACLKIIRTFRVIDWCIDDGPGSIFEPFEFVQTIKVNNTEGPEIEVFADTVFCSFEVDCGAININDYLVAEATDDCTANDELLNRYEVTDADDKLVDFGTGLDASGTYDIGTYTVRFISEDKCGNQEIEESTFEVRSCKLPTPYCLKGLSTTLTAMDTTGDGTADAEMVMLAASFFDAGSYHPCGYDVVLSFSEDVNDTLRTFFCSDTTGLQPIELWVTDSNGGQDFCSTFIDIQDNDEVELCGGLRPVDIEGRIYTEADVELYEAEVELRGLEVTRTMTDENGIYAFNSMPQGGNYRVLPIKDNDYLNGVSTLDLVLIQRHILELAPLSSGYKRLAADINNNDAISSTDLLELRKVILGIEDGFPNNTSWRFIDSKYELEEDEDPWISIFEESYDISSLNSDMQIDFVAVKVGDVDGNVDMNVKAGVVSETRSSKTLTLELPNTTVERGNLYEIEVMVRDEVQLFGMQHTLNMNGLELMDIKAGGIDLKKEFTYEKEGQLNTSYASARGDQIAKDEVLYTMVLKANTDGELSDMIRLNADGLNAEFYHGEGLEKGNLDIVWRESDANNVVEMLSLIGNSPNPWSYSTELNFYLPSSGKVNLIIKDANGRVLLNRKTTLNSGSNSLRVTDNEIPVPGVHFYELRFKDQIVNGKMIKIQ